MKELASLNHYLWRYKWQLSIGFVFVVISNLFAVFPAQVVRHAFDLVQSNLKLYQIAKDTDLQNNLYETLASILLFMGAVILTFAIVRGLFTFLMRQTIIVVSRKIEKDLKDDIYKHLQTLSLSFYRRNNTGDIMARLTEDVSAVRMYLGPGLMYTVNLVSLITIVLVIMFSVNITLTLYVLTPLPILAVSIYFVNSLILKRSTAIQEQMSTISTFVQEMFSGIRVLKSFAAENLMSKFFVSESEDYKRKSLELVQVNALFIPLIILLIGISNLLTIYIGGQLVLQGKTTAGNIAEFFIYVNLLTWPVAALGWVTALIQKAAASQKRINKLLDTKAEIVSGNLPVNNYSGKVQFTNVSFKYPDTGIQAIKNVSFDLMAGETVGIIGRTGSGKSSLVNLLLRQYDPDSGTILVDDLELKNIDLESFRKQVGFVPQDNFLFGDTLKNNILWGSNDSEQLPDAELQEKIEEVCKIADLYNDILSFDKQFETILGERGITLSGGQKQRLSIARAIYGSPKLLVLDDSFSAVDTHTEARIIAELSKYIKNITTILVSHRVSTVKNADKIIVLENGEIAEMGTHQELIDQKKYYYSLYKKQLLEKELNPDS